MDSCASRSAGTARAAGTSPRRSFWAGPLEPPSTAKRISLILESTPDVVPEIVAWQGNEAGVTSFG
jgi:hypothetical protein